MRYHRSNRPMFWVLFFAALFATTSAFAEKKEKSAWILIDGGPELPKYLTTSPFFGSLELEKLANDAGYAVSCDNPVPSYRDGSLMLRLIVKQTRDDVKDDPDAIIKAICNRLQQTLNLVAGPRPDEIKRREIAVQQVKRSEGEVAGLRRELTDLKHFLFHHGGGITLEGLAHQRSELQTQKIMLQVELAGLQARREAIVKHIVPHDEKAADKARDSQRKLEELKLKKLETQLAYSDRMRERLEVQHDNATIPFSELEKARLKVAELKLDIEWQKEMLRNLTAKSKAQPNNQPGQPDSKLKYLEAALRVQEKECQRLIEANKKIPGTIPQREIELARLEMQKMHLEIEAYRQSSDRTPHNEMLAGLTHQLADIEIETATIEAKIKAVDRILGKINLEKLQQIDGRIEEVEGRLEDAIDRRGAARERLAMLERQQEEHRPPKVTLVDDLDVEKMVPSNQKPAEKKQ